MKKLITGISVTLASLVFSGALAAQEEEEDVVEQMEQMAEESAELADQIGESIEAWAEEHSAELERWAERYSAQWEDWGERFEERMEDWAEQQEDVWEDWAERYSEKWEEWGSKLESGELDSDQLSELIERNLEMLSEMPLGEMIQGVLKEGVGGLKSAPWESLNELQDMVQDSLEQSLKEMEDLDQASGESRERLERSGDKLTKALSSVRGGLDAKLKRLDEDAKVRLQQLKELLENTELTKQQREIIREMADTIRDERVRRATELRKDAEVARTRARAAAREARQDRQQLQKLEERVTGELAEDVRRAKRKAREDRTADLRKAREDAKDAFYQEALRKRDSVKAKDSEIEDLLREIKELRQEVQELKDAIDD